MSKDTKKDAPKKDAPKKDAPKTEAPVETKKTEAPKKTETKVEAPVETKKGKKQTKVISEKKAKNPMRQIQIEKLCLNICTGEAGDALTKASTVLNQLTDQKPKLAKARITIRSFGIRRDQKIACHVTVRGEKAEEILKRGLRVKEFELRERNFSRAGHFGFGISEHIDLGMKYDPSIGIFGMDFYVVLQRPGTRVSRRKHARGRVGPQHLITKEDAMHWFVDRYQGTIF